MSVQVNKGAVKFKSIRAMAEAAGVNYITMYMRLRMTANASKAFHKPVRAYRKKQEAATA